MANFSVVNTTNTGQTLTYVTATTYKTAAVIFNSTVSDNPNFTGIVRRGKLYDILVGTAGTPADNYMEYDVVRVAGVTGGTTLGSLSSFSSLASIDMGDSFGCINHIGANSSVETLVTVLNGEMWYVGVNQRASYRWVAAPGSELVWPGISSANSSASGGNGIACRARSGGYTGVTTVNLLFSE
jgi:hypothetical protein